MKFFKTALLSAALSVLAFSGGAQERSVTFLGRTSEFSTALDRVSDGQSLYWGIGCIGEARFGPCYNVCATSSVADIKPVTYENGQVIIEDDCVFLTSSSRTTYCGAQIWKMGIHTGEFELVGNILYESEGVCHAHYICSSLMFDRRQHLWIVTTDLWDGDKLMYSGSSVEDLRYGFHLTHVDRIDCENPSVGDEDQYILYDDDPSSPLYGKYVLTHTRIHNGNYAVHVQTSDNWYGPYRLYGHSDGKTSYTGVFTQNVGGKRYFITGCRMDTSRPETDEYRVLSYPSLEVLGKLDYDKLTGGFGGWGSLFAVPSQNNTKYLWVTFDRGRTSDYDNWTYGTTHVYESVEENRGREYPVTMLDGYVHPADVRPDYSPMDLTFKRRIAKTFYYTDWLRYSGFEPNFDVNRQFSNELPLVNAALEYKDRSVILRSTGEGIGSIAPYLPLGAYKLRVYRVDGTAEFCIFNSDRSKMRKLVVAVRGKKAKVTSSDSFDGEVTHDDNMNFEFKGEYADVLVGVNPKDFSVIVLQD